MEKWRYGVRLITSKIFFEEQESRLITLLVGVDERKFTVREGYLRTVNFFNNLFRHGFKESEEGVIRLPDDDPVIIEIFLVWLLVDPLDWLNLPSGNLTYDWSGDRLDLAVSVIRFADKIQLTSFMRRGVELLWDCLMPHNSSLTALGEDRGEAFVALIISTYDKLADIRAKFVPLHLAMVLGETNESKNFKERRDAMFVKQGHVRLFTDYNKHKTVFETILRANDDMDAQHLKYKPQLLIQVVLDRGEFDDLLQDNALGRLESDFGNRDDPDNGWATFFGWLNEIYGT